MGPALAAMYVSGTSLLRESLVGKPSAKPVIAGFLLGAILYGCAAFDPRFGVWACILVVSSATLINGSAVFGTVSNALK
jgi:hypothetical protein